MSAALRFRPRIIDALRGYTPAKFRQDLAPGSTP